MNQFNVGDVVQLNSGGPKMTVTELAGDQVWCMWFEGPKQQQAIFAVNALKSAVA